MGNNHRSNELLSSVELMIVVYYVFRVLVIVGTFVILCAYYGAKRIFLFLKNIRLY